MGKKLKVVCDIDGTLFDINDKPREDVIQLLRLLNRFGFDIYIHSGGGIDYAIKKVRLLKLDQEMHIHIIDKGNKNMNYDIAIDDCFDDKANDDNADWSKYIKSKVYIKV